MSTVTPTVALAATGSPVAAATRARVTGIDLARGLAMCGMLAAHVGPADGDGTVVGALMTAAHGRSSILFATLAGVSLAFMSGGATATTGTDGRKATRRIATRAVLILALGTLLVALGTPVSVILGYYGIFFLFTLPFLRLRARTLFVLAGALAIIAPTTSMLVQGWPPAQAAIEQIDRFDPISALSGEGIAQLILTGAYPAWTWMPFLFVGLGLGRLGVAQLRCIPLALTGLALMLAGYAGSALALRLLPGTATDTYASKGDGGFGWSFLLGAEEHSGTPFEIVGGIGTALVVIAVSLWLAERLPKVTWPVAAIGTMSLTVYTGHVLAINLLGLSANPGEPVWVLAAFIAAAAAFAVIWLRFFRRGPFETIMHTAVTRAPWAR